MLKKHLVGWLIVVFLYPAWISNTFAQSLEQEAGVRRKLEEIVSKRGIGAKARVTVKLRDRSEVKGYVTQMRDHSFSVLDQKSKQDKTISYSEVTDVKGKGLHIAAKIAIGAGVGAAILVGIVVGGCQAGWWCG